MPVKQSYFMEKMGQDENDADGLLHNDLELRLDEPNSCKRRRNPLVDGTEGWHEVDPRPIIF